MNTLGNSECLLCEKKYDQLTVLHVWYLKKKTTKQSDFDCALMLIWALPPYSAGQLDGYIYIYSNYCLHAIYLWWMPRAIQCVFCVKKYDQLFVLHVWYLKTKTTKQSDLDRALLPTLLRASSSAFFLASSSSSDSGTFFASPFSPLTL